MSPGKGPGNWIFKINSLGDFCQLASWGNQMRGLFDNKRKVRHKEREATYPKSLSQEGAGPGFGPGSHSRFSA